MTAAYIAAAVGVAVMLAFPASRILAVVVLPYVGRLFYRGLRRRARFYSGARRAAGGAR